MGLLHLENNLDQDQQYLEEDSLTDSANSVFCSFQKIILIEAVITLVMTRPLFRVNLFCKNTVQGQKAYFSIWFPLRNICI